MSWNDPTITPAILLQYMQGMKYELLQGAQDMKRELLQEIRAVDTRLDKVETRLEWLQVKVGNIDGRQDAVELEFLPKKVRDHERRIGVLERTSSAR